MEQSEAMEQLTAHALTSYGFSPEDIQAVQAALFKLLSRRVSRYTMGDSSSVPIETAEALFSSLCFSIGLHIKQTGYVEALKATDYDALLKDAWATLESEAARGKLLLRQALITAPDLPSRAYGDTLQGISEFFKRYDHRFFAHEIPGSIDYPLCHPVPERCLGVEYINAYLERLLTENAFCAYFAPKRMDRLLKSVSPDYADLLVNLYEPVATNALGRTLLGLDAAPLEIADADRARLAALLDDKDSTALGGVLTGAVQTLCRQLEIPQPPRRQYLMDTALALIPRIQAVKGRYSYLFPSLQEE